jgi:signal peptidase I
MMLRPGRRIAIAVIVGLGAVIVGAICLGILGVVVTHGTSMNPRYHEGDVVVVRAQETYAVGQIVAYRDRVHDLVVLHRIMGGDSGGYQFKGDNNQSVDVVHPDEADLIGRAVLHIPQAGAWLRRLTRPVPLAVFAFVVLAGGGGAVRARKRRRRRGIVSRHAASATRSSALMATQSPRLRAAAGATVAIAGLGLALGALSWTRPVDILEPGGWQPSRSMTFSYSAAVPMTAAYDGATARSPDPVFRRLVDTVDVHFTYRGTPGSVSVDAELATASGWHTTIPLAAKTFTARRYTGTTRLDLAALENRARAAAAVTGLPADQLTISVIPRVVGRNGTSFAPTLRLALTGLELKLAEGPESLTVKDTAAVPRSRHVPRTLAVLGRRLPVTTGRTLSTAILLGALLAALGLLPVARRATRTSEGAAIRRRYGPLLVPVHPMPTPEGRPVVEVSEFAALARLAESYGLLILRWSQCEGETFIVQDQGITYRYRTGELRAAAMLGIPHADVVPRS